MLTPQQVLQQYFGYDSFRPPQGQIIDSVLTNSATVAILPTGGGKSLCYQVPGLLLPGLTVVVSPLVSLMSDQVTTLKRKKISAEMLTSQQSPADQKNILEAVEQGKVKFLYVSPERLTNTIFLGTIHKVLISLLAVDEAHCVSIWGHDFRPAYQKINQFVQTLPTQPKIIAVTATATPKALQDIIQFLNLQSPQIFQTSSKRSNLFLQRIPCGSQTEKKLFLLMLLKNKTGAGIIYCSTVNQVETLAEWLRNHHIPAGMYHGRLTSAERTVVQAGFLANTIPIIVATNAFGMGVDKPDIRWVIHYQAPANIENYFQEVGRAGRDGQPAECFLLVFEKDFQIQAEFIHKSKNETYKSNQVRKLLYFQQFCVQARCLNWLIGTYFGEKPEESCQSCHHCQPAEIVPEDLYKKIKMVETWRQTIAIKHQTRPHHFLTHQQMLFWSVYQPRTLEEVQKIPGIGYCWVERWKSELTGLC